MKTRRAFEIGHMRESQNTQSMITLYGLKTCDTCRKALRALKEAGHTVDFVDIRADADLATLVPQWLDAVGPDALVNKKSTSWRGLSETDRSRADGGRVQTDPAGLLCEHPTLIKRPVVMNDRGDIGVGRAALDMVEAG